MKRNDVNLSISPTSLSSFSDLPTPNPTKPLTPGCPTDSNLYSHRFQTALRTPLSAFTTIPHTATTMTRRASVVPTSSSIGPTTTFGSDSDEAIGHTPQWRIQPGTYIVFELDTDFIAERMKADQHHDLSFVAGAEEIRSFPKGRYIGLVLWSHTYTYNELSGSDADSDESYPDNLGPREIVEELIVNFVAPVAPPPPFHSHCVPITPTTNVSGGMHDEPLQTTTLFPFPELFQWTTLGTRLEVRTVHDSTLRFGLKEDEFGRLDERVAVDFRELGDIHDTADAVERLKVPMYTLPATVWRDVREAGRASQKGSVGGGLAHPMKFVEEVEELAK